MASLLGQVCTAPLIGGFGDDALTLLDTNASCKLHRLSARDEQSMSNFGAGLSQKLGSSAVRHPWLQPYNATAEESSRALAPAEKTRELAACKTLANRPSMRCGAVLSIAVACLHRTPIEHICTAQDST